MKTDVRDETPTATRAADEHPSAKDRLRDTAASARERASEAYEAARERTGALYGSAREQASSAGRRAAKGVSANPVAAVVGGLAVGAALAALLPKTRQEVRALGTVGSRFNSKARAAAKSATDASRAKLDELGYATVKDKIGEFVGAGKKA